MLSHGLALQVAANKLAGAGGPLQLAAALSWLHRAMLVEAMAVFPLLLWVREHQSGVPPCIGLQGTLQRPVQSLRGIATAR